MLLMERGDLNVGLQAVGSMVCSPAPELDGNHSLQDLHIIMGEQKIMKSWAT